MTHAPAAPEKSTSSATERDDGICITLTTVAGATYNDIGHNL